MQTDQDWNEGQNERHLRKAVVLFWGLGDDLVTKSNYPLPTAHFPLPTTNYPTV